MSCPSPRRFAGLRIVSHDANKTTYEVWPKPKPTKKKKKARPRIPKGPLVAAALAAADDAGTRHHVQDIYFAYEHYTQTARLVRCCSLMYFLSCFAPCSLTWNTRVLLTVWR